MAAHAYTLLGHGFFYVPKHRLAVMPVVNEFTEHNVLAVAMMQEVNRDRGERDEVTATVHVLSRRMDVYRVGQGRGKGQYDDAAAPGGWLVAAVFE